MQNVNEAHNLTLDRNQYLIVNNMPQVEPGLGLFGICDVLYQKRKLIFSTTLICSLLAMILSLAIRPVYQVKTSLVQPNQDQMQALYLNTNSTLTSANVFTIFLKTLSKKSNYIEFLQASGLLDESLKKIENPTDKDRLGMLKRLAKNYDVVIVNHFVNDPKDSFKDSSLEAELVTRSNTFDAKGKENQAYIAYTNKKLLDALAIGEKSVAETRIVYLNKWINLRDKELLIKRENEIKRLYDKQALTITEIKNKIISLNQKDVRDRAIALQDLNNALKIAEKLGITDYDSSLKLKNHGLVIDVNSKKMELYLRGTEYLKKAIELTKAQQHTLGYEAALSQLKEQLYIAENDKLILSLEKRMDDKPYIKDIEKKQIELMRLKSLSFDLSDTKFYSIIGSPIIDSTPITPSKKLITLFGFIFGLVISAAFVLLQQAVKKRNLVESKYSSLDKECFN